MNVNTIEQSKVLGFIEKYFKTKHLELKLIDRYSILITNMKNDTIILKDSEIYSQNILIKGSLIIRWINNKILIKEVEDKLQEVKNLLNNIEICIDTEYLEEFLQGLRTLKI